MKNMFFLFVLLLLSVSCSSKSTFKSPCVDNGGPCKHIPINNWWLPMDLQFNPTYNG